MEINPSEIEGVRIVTSKLYEDARGTFREWFKKSELLNQTSADFQVAQSNVSKSNKGAIRGIHFSREKNSQKKWVTCLNGSIYDVVVDLRVNSKTFGRWAGIILAPELGNSVYIDSGIGHAFIALEENTIVSYLISSEYDPSTEFNISPFDESLSIKWPIKYTSISEKDKNAPNFVDYFKNEF
jgi:dTDP-4-dehydrorhamnose 3,5-epimerase